MEKIGTSGTNGSFSGNTKRKRGRNYCFTLNNPEIEMAQIIQVIIKDYPDLKYCIGNEIGESGTKHLQGFLSFKNPMSFSTLKKYLPKSHIEICKGGKNANLAYCKKDGDFITNFPLSRKERALNSYNAVVWKPWQNEIIKLINEEPNNRDVHYFYEKNGNVGKSFLCKYLCLKYNAILADGKKSDVFNQVKVWDENNPEEDIKLVLIDIPRSGYNNFSYKAIEALKTGMLYSGKYEGGLFVFDKPPHVVIFANEEPDLDKTLSEDRWKIKVIE